MRDLAFLAAKKRADKAEAEIARLTAEQDEAGRENFRIAEVNHALKADLAAARAALEKIASQYESDENYQPEYKIAKATLSRLGTGEALQAVREAYHAAINLHPELEDHPAFVGLKAVFGE